MNDISSKAELQIDLDRGTMIAVPDGFGIELFCKSGMLWLTQLGKFNDLIIHSGETMVIAKGEDSLIRAFADSSVEINAPDIRRGRLRFDFSSCCYELGSATMRQVIRVRGKCSIRVVDNGSEVLVH